jgi:WD40 repeat protein
VLGDGKFLTLSPDWSQIATRPTPEDRSTILLLDAASGQQLGSWSFTDGRTIWPVFSPDGKMLAIFGGDVLQLCDTTNGNTLGVLQGDRKFQASAVAFSQDGKKIVTTYQFMENPIWHDSPPDGNIQVWDVAGGTKVMSYHVTEKESIYALAFSPDGTILAAMTLLQLILWDLTNGSLLKTMEPRALAYYFAFTPSWKLMAVGGDAGGVVLLDPSSGPRMPLEPYVFGVNSLSFSPDGKRLAATDSAGSVFIWGVLP